MPIIYLNGSAPNYLGFQYSTSTELLTAIRDNLLTAGWTTHSDITDNSLTMRGNTSNSHYCYVIFSVTTVSSTRNRLTIRGDLDGTGITLSPDATNTIDFDTNLTNHLYLTADNDSGCICIISGNSAIPVQGQHFGFCDRIDITDQFAWYIGDLISWNLQQTFTAKSKFNNTGWKRLGTDFISDVNYTSVNNTTFGLVTSSIAMTHRGILDFMVYPASSNANSTTVAMPTVNSLAAAGSNRLVNYMCTAGQLNGATGQPIISPYYYLEGRGSETNYPPISKSGFILPNQLFFRGVIKFVVTGVSSLLEGEQCIIADGSRYLSCGTIGWQGMKIKGAD